MGVYGGRTTFSDWRGKGNCWANGSRAVLLKLWSVLHQESLVMERTSAELNLRVLSDRIDFCLGAAHYLVVHWYFEDHPSNTSSIHVQITVNQEWIRLISNVGQWGGSWRGFFEKVKGKKGFLKTKTVKLSLEG